MHFPDAPEERLELSRRTGIGENRLREIEEGADYTIKEWGALNRAMGVRSHDLLHAPERHDEYALLFRKSLPRQRRTAATESAAAALANALSRMLELDDPKRRNLKWLDVFGVLDKSQAAAEWAAGTFRDVYQHGDQLAPATDLGMTLADRLRVFIHVFPGNALEGASAIVQDDAFIFLAARSFKPRMLFTLAHELGHLVGGHHEGEQVHVDPEESNWFDKRKSSKEKFADWFASALLLPKAGVGTCLKQMRSRFGNAGDLGDLEILYLARFFGVSFEVAAYRCEVLKLLPAGGANSLAEGLKTRYGSAEKAAESLGLPDRAPIEIPLRPTALFDEMVERIQRGDLSAGRAAGLLQINLATLYEVNAKS